ncbi:hypothetical protein [Streptomyces melanosporofaciens]|uniref:hypothetical protein n=1 Tax=Streptomyces melanosporofaciens TaxID=67327 RepID=UPI000B879609|nr:hypothetical protein [Streptomyces melanosporofaciens]
MVFPYLDNDIGSYPHLDHYAQLARDVLGVKLRISTVGYSRHSTRLAAVHQHLVKEFTDVFDGIRFSITPYTLGFTGRSGVDRQAYIEDLAAACGHTGRYWTCSGTAPPPPRASSVSPRSSGSAN